MVRLFVPTLLVIDLNPKMCARASTFIASFSSLIAFVSHIFKSNLKFTITILTVISVILGSQLGSRFMVTKLGSESVRKLFGMILLGITVLLILRNK